MKRTAQFFHCFEEDPLYRLGFAVIFLVGCVHRVIALSLPLVGDEVTTYLDYISQSFTTLISQNYIPNNHIFHSVLVFFTQKLLGDSLVTLRIPAFAAGVLVMPLGYFTARRFFGRQVALMTGVMLSASAPLVYFSAVARGYSIIILASLGLAVVADLLARRDETRLWTVLIVISVVGFYTIPVMLYPFGGIAVWMLWLFTLHEEFRSSIKAKKLVLSILATGAIVIVLYAPVIAGSGWDALTANQFVAPLPWADFLQSIRVEVPRIWTYLNNGSPYLVPSFCGAGLLLYILRPGNNNEHRKALIIITILWTVAVVLAQRVIGFERVWTFFIPFYIMYALAGWMQLGKVYLEGIQSSHFVVSACILAVVLSFISHSYQSSPLVRSSDGVREMAVFLSGVLRGSDIVVSEYENYYAAKYYFDRQSIQNRLLDGSSPWELGNPSGKIFMLLKNPKRVDVVASKIIHLADSYIVKIISQRQIVSGGVYLIEVEINIAE